MFTESTTDDLAPRWFITILGTIVKTIRKLRLEGDRVDSISVKTFIDHPSDLHEILHRILRHHDVHRGKRFLLIQAPDMKLMDRSHTLDLVIVSIGMPLKCDNSIPFLDHASHHPCSQWLVRSPAESVQHFALKNGQIWFQERESIFDLLNGRDDSMMRMAMNMLTPGSA